MVYPSDCCSALVAVLGSKIWYPENQAYNQSLTSYFSAQEAEVYPSCIVSPASTADVSAAVATLSHGNCSFAIRSGGHSTWAGDANIVGGVTIDLQSLNATQLNDDKTIASVGPGSRWGKAYEAVEAYGRGLPGGRVGTVGVGGLSLGGGISSFSPRYGWTCDSIANVEIVLADGAIINANETHNTDLLHALRGGSNNFGVVTRIDFRIFEQGDIWGGVVNYDIDTVPQQLNATANLAAADPYDEYASLVQNFVFTTGEGQSVSNTLHYTKPVEYPDFFKPFTDIPQTDNTLRVANVSNFGNEGVDENPDGYRALLATTSIRASLEMLTAAFDAWNASLEALSSATGLVQTRLIVEPIPQIAYRKAAPGTNMLNLSEDEGTLVIIGVAGGWANTADDALVTQAAQDIISKINTQAKVLGQSFDLVYLNYASPWQDVIAGYGPESLAKLQSVSRKYDPKGVFQKNVPGGFKLF
ncbi:hypothetical protein F5B19DRAFT_497707 [Rostrohypoxylon terebratum]|nr:hypothetical protein F5B19DRAFT_497707 [Rostrohypoxylon terebratum]